MALLTVLIMSVTGANVAIVAMNDGGKSTIQQAATSPTIAGTSLLFQSQLQMRLGGSEQLRTLEVTTLKEMLADARDLEARFDSRGAAALRTAMVDAFNTCPRPNPEVATVVAMAMHDAAAALFNDGKEKDAIIAAEAALRRFPDTPIDANRHPPAVIALIDRAKRSLETSPHGKVHLVATIPGTFVIEGADPTVATTAIVVNLPVGNYRVWWVGDCGTSLPHFFTVTEKETAVDLDPRWETRVELVPVVSLTCNDTCVDDLQSLGQRVGADRIIGVSNTGGYNVDVASGNSTPWQPSLFSNQKAALETTIRPKFSPWYLVPLGVGQFAQDRPIFAGGYAAAQAGLLAWHLYTWQKHATAVDEDDHGAEPDLRSQRNLSAVLFYGSLVASIVEALIVGWVTGE